MLTGLAAVCWHKLDSKAPRGKTLRASVETLFQHSKNLVNSCSNLLPVPKEVMLNFVLACSNLSSQGC